MIKNLKYLFLFVFCANAFAQKEYKFDYYAVYEFKKSEEDSISSKNITIANSENSNYFIIISVYLDKTGQIFFYDIERSKSYFFSFKGKIDEKIDFSSLFNNPTPFRYDLKELRKKVVDKHDIIYQKDEIIIRNYKNKRKKKITSDYHLIMESNEITKNQLYTSNIIFNYKFDINQIKTDKIIRESFVIKYDNNKKGNKKENIRTLKDVQSIDFVLNIPEIENTITIPKIQVRQ